MTNKSLTDRLLRPLVIAGVVVASISVAIMRESAKEMANDRLKLRTSTIALEMAHAARSFVSVEELQSLIETVDGEPEVELIVVVAGRSPKVVASTKKDWIGRSIDELPYEDVAEDLEAAIENPMPRGRYHERTKNMDATYPLHFTDGSIKGPSAVMVHLDARPTIAAVNRWSIKAALLILGGILAIVLIAVGLLRRRVVQPLQAVDECLRADKFGESIKVVADDEIGRLVGAVNSAHAEVAETLRQLRSLGHSLDCAAIVAVTDTKGTIRYVNQKFVEISGWSRDELIGANHRILNSGHHPRSYFTLMYRSIAGGDVWRGEICNKKKNGEIYWVDTTIVPQRNAHGRVERYTSIRFDITERKIAEKELVLARDAAESATRAKSSFLATMSHEIRTPMNGILGFSDLLLEESKDPMLRDYASMIRSSASALLAILNDILDFSKIEAGKLVLENVPVDLSGAAREVVRLFHPRATEKGIRVDLDWVEGTPECSVGDSTRIRQILLNLVGNAVKFTPSGAVTLRVSSPSANRIRFEVIDDGVGIPEEMIGNLFSKFMQADSSTTRKFGGTGLGLAISKQLVEMMGGKIGVTSTLGKGSTFWFELPLVATGCERVRSDHGGAIDKDHPGEKKRVLLAEDNPVNQKLATLVLERLGHEVEIAVDGKEAVEKALRSTYDLILMDCLMPRIDGYEATAEIRRHESSLGLARCPIIALTANAMTADRDLCRIAGMDDFVAKPFKTEEIAAAIRRCDSATGPFRPDAA